MVLTHYADKIVSVVFFIAIITIIGLYFFPQSTLNVVGLAAIGIKPVLGLISAIFNLIIEIIKAVIGVF